MIGKSRRRSQLLLGTVEHPGRAPFDHGPRQFHDGATPTIAEGAIGLGCAERDVTGTKLDRLLVVPRPNRRPREVLR